MVCSRLEEKYGNVRGIHLQCCLREGRQGGARNFKITGDFFVELGLMCDKDPCGFKKTMWYGIVKEFDCKVCLLRGQCVETEEQKLLHIDT